MILYPLETVINISKRALNPWETILQPLKTVLNLSETVMNPLET